MPDHTQSFKERSKDDQAEEYFVSWAKRNKLIFTRYGFDLKTSGISGKDFIKIPKFIRCSPDYLVIGKEARLVEVKGGTNFLRLKVSDLTCYDKWNKEIGVYYFFYSSHYKAYKIKEHKEVLEVIKKCDVGQFHDHTKYDKKLYYKIDWILL